MYSFSYLEPICSMSSSICCFLTCIPVSQEAGQVIWYSHLFQNFPQFIVIHTVNIDDWFPLGWIGLISLLSQGLSRVFYNTTVQKHQFFSAQPSLRSNSHSRTSTGKTIALTRWTFVGKVMSQLFNMLSRFVIAFLPGNKHVLISAAVTVYSDLGAQENIICHCFHFFPVYFP